MTQAHQRHILLCVAGMTPQVITETLYVLTQVRRERIDEIRVITTLDGRKKIMAGIVDGRGSPEDSLLDPQAGQFYAFCRDYGIDHRKIKFDDTTIRVLGMPDGSNLEDIRSVEENICAGDQICEIVRELASTPDTSIHASAAGGRKTMSIYLTAAMQLFGRKQDRLSHVLVSEQFETHPQFFYKPPVPRELPVRDRATGKQTIVSTEFAEIYLAEIPFIRLRGVMSDWLKRGGLRYSDYVQRAEEDLQLLELANDVHIMLREKRVLIAGRGVRLAEREFFVYALYAWFRKNGRGDSGFVDPEEIHRQDFEAVFRMITSARGKERPLEDWDLVPRYKFLGTLVAQAASDRTVDRDDLKQALREIIAKIKKRFDEAALPERYLVSARERGSSRYGLAVEPERILWS